MQWRIAVLVFLIVAAALGSRQAQAQPRPAGARADARVALLIANAAYPEAEAKLTNPVRDARALADELRRNGFDVALRENLGKDEMQRAIDGFEGAIAPGSAALFYFSGYAVQINRQNYLVPIDARIWSEREAQQDGISVEKVLGQMHAKGATVKVLILDAARRNPFERRFRSYSAGLSAIAVPAGVLAINSAALDKVHDDGDGNPSLFMAELLKEMRAPTATPAEQILLRTRNGVARATNGERVPWISSSLTEDFFFSRPAAPAAAAPAPVAAAPATRP